MRWLNRPRRYPRRIESWDTDGRMDNVDEAQEGQFLAALEWVEV